MTKIVWKQGNHSGHYASIKGIRIGSLQWSMLKHEGNKDYCAYFGLPGVKIKDGLHFSLEEGKACIERCWNKWFAQITKETCPETSVQEDENG